MSLDRNRRRFLRDAGLSVAALPFLGNLPSLGFDNQKQRKKRLVVMFSPNGVVPKAFWPEKDGAEFELPTILKPLEPFKKQVLTLHGVCDKIRGDGDNHMRGMGCLLTGVELFPGNIQGGSHTPAGWASGHSIDQEIARFYAKDPATKTRFPSLEFGVMVPERADTWTRMCYTGPNQPIAPIDDPYRMFGKLYGRLKDRENLVSVLDDVADDLKKVASALSAEDRRLLDQHATFVREMEKDLKEDAKQKASRPAPKLEPGVRRDNDQIPKISKLQIELMVESFASDFTRVATLQYTNSVGQARMNWIGVSENHHELSHEPDSNAKAVEKLTKINVWFAEQLAYLSKRLAETPEPGGQGSLLDNTTIVWTNELGKGNSHTLDDIPFVIVGGGCDFKTGRALKFKKIPHNRLLLSLAHGMGRRIDKFGNPDHCGGGPISELT